MCEAIQACFEEGSLRKSATPAAMMLKLSAVRTTATGCEHTSPPRKTALSCTSSLALLIAAPSGTPGWATDIALASLDKARSGPYLGGPCKKVRNKPTIGKTHPLFVWLQFRNFEIFKKSKNRICKFSNYTARLQCWSTKKNVKLRRKQFHMKDTGKSSSRKLRHVIYYTLYRMDPQKTHYKISFSATFINKYISRKLRRVIYYTLYRMDPQNTY